MKSLSNPAVVASLRARIAALTPADNRRWGSMTVAQMVCHLTDAFSGPLGERSMSPCESGRPPIPLGVYKCLALYFPRKWPQGVPTIPNMDQQIGGTPPTVFDADLALLLSRLHAFAGFTGPWPAHPIFGPMNHAEWMRWGWLHTDHHLRQFGR